MGTDWSVLVAPDHGESGPYVIRIYEVKEPFDWSKALPMVWSTSLEGVQQRGRIAPAEAVVNWFFEQDDGHHGQRVKINVATGLIAQREYARALTILEGVLESLNPASEFGLFDEVLALTALSTLHQQTGEWHLARRCIDQALTACERPDAPAFLRVQALHSLGNHCIHLGDFEQGLVSLEKAVSVASGIEDVSGNWVTILSIEIADAFAMCGREQEAISRLDDLVSSIEKTQGRDALLVAMVVERRAHLLDLVGREPDAGWDLPWVFERYRAQLGEHHPRTAEVRAFLALRGAKEGNRGHAVSEMEEAVEDLVEWYGANHPKVAIARSNLGFLYLVEGRVERAWEELRQAVDSIDRTLKSTIHFMSERERLVHLADHRLYLDRLLSLAVHAGDERYVYEAYCRVVDWKGRVTRGMESLRQRAVDDPGPENVVLLRELREVRRDLSRQAQLPEPVSSEDLASLRARRDRLERELAMMLGSDVGSGSISLGEALDGVPWDGALVDFLAFHPIFESPARLVAFVTVGRGGVPKIVDLGPLEAVESAVTEYLTFVSSSSGVSDIARGVGVEETVAAVDAGRLRSLLWDPLAPMISSVKTIFVSPDGPLAGFPFEVLQLEEGRFLVETYRVAYLQDATRLARKARTVQPSILIVGGVDYRGNQNEGRWLPLRSTLVEAREIERLHNLRVDDSAELLVLVGREPTETRVRNEMSRFGTLHFATHGFYRAPVRNEESPWARALSFWRSGLIAEDVPGAMSGLVCAGIEEGRDDGLLTAEEVGWMDLSGTGLVVMSACASGIGMLQPGEGMLGLSRAFLVAGVDTVIGSLWAVDDHGTAELMRSFYDRLWGDGSSRLDALRGAQLDLLSREGSPETRPAVWGAFVLQGQP